ncbi:uncharacterized protein TRAVEDRAFT_53110 [Trametes versicolor FP-101664 SS1]|uniref:uncharacterized protein n=1 Tax=Trametes versicolor (strain FP-101664) TaxID=717944 RepID=UPI00046242CD|nr:uncharacterized protein TRAVEDRAFT_53110 [Trametes versicolor FP-101664 SS1]EIW52668.1 hypothetical protein TRAVEDRAFT_53110 [Trametes versicolor FP-101664 SS1]
MLSDDGIRSSTADHASTLLLDENLPSPLYGLPGIGVEISKPLVSPVQAGKTDEHAQLQTFELKLLSLRALWNANVAIHALPAEVLLEVFKYLLAPQYRYLGARGGDLRRPWARLMGVCRHWCALIRKAAVFWTTIEVSTKTSWLKLALRRSGSAPIRVTLSSGCDMDITLPALVQHSSHLGALNMYTPTTHALQPLFSRVLPLLRALDLTNQVPDLTNQLDPSLQHVHSGKSTVFISHDNCPRLAKLSLTRFTFAWTSPLLANLQNLTLRDCQLSTKPLPFAEFLDVLEHAQRLQDLQLGHFLSTALSTQTSVPNERLVTLPKLTFLQCADVPAHIARLVSHLRTLSVCDFELTGDSDPNDPSASYASLLPRAAATQATFTSPVFSIILEVGHKANAVALELASGGTCRLELFSAGAVQWDRWLERGLRQLLALFPSGEAQMTTLSIEGNLNSVSLDTWVSTFDTFPMLQTLTLDAQDVDEFPAALTDALSVLNSIYMVMSGGKARWSTSSHAFTPVLGAGRRS